MRRSTIILIGLALTLAACGGSESDTAIQVTYDGSTCTYDGSGSVAAGMTSVTFVNETDTDTGLDLRRLKEGVTYEDFEVAASSGPPDGVAIQLLWLIGDESNPQAGNHAQEVQLKAGTHGMSCVTFPADGPPTIVFAGPIEVS